MYYSYISQQSGNLFISVYLTTQKRFYAIIDMLNDIHGEMWTEKKVLFCRHIVDILSEHKAWQMTIWYHTLVYQKTVNLAQNEN